MRHFVFALDMARPMPNRVQFRINELQMVTRKSGRNIFLDWVRTT